MSPTEARIAALTASGRPVHREHVEGADTFLAAHLGRWTAEPARDGPRTHATGTGWRKKATKAGKQGATGALDGKQAMDGAGGERHG